MIVSPDKNGNIDHVVLKIFNGFESGIPIIPITFTNDYEFNPELHNIKKYILVDYCEYGANSWDQKQTHLWGLNSSEFPKTQTDEYKKFDEFVTANPPLIYFKRELLKKDMGGNIYPIDFPAFHMEAASQSRKEFESRPIEVFFNWGHSHESRRSLHGNIFLNSTQRGYGVIDNFYHIEQGIKEYKRVWVTIQTPHYARIPMEQVLFVQSQSKVSVSLPGAGCKCFRHTEASVNSVMLMEDTPLAWSYEWEFGVNCMKFPGGENMDEIRGLKNQWKIINTIHEAFEWEDLYGLYLNGVENCKKYYLPNYLKNYITPIIKKYA